MELTNQAGGDGQVSPPYQDTIPQNANHDSISTADMPQTRQEEEQQSWRTPPKNTLRTIAVFWSFLVFGLNDGAYGVVLPCLETRYELSYLVVSLIFLSPLLGYTAAALLNSTIHLCFGQRGIALLASCIHVVSYAIISIQPPYPVIVVMYALVGFGYGLIDAAWNVWTGNLKNANAVQGLLSSCYSLGMTVSPVIVTTMSTKQDWGWYTYYWLMLFSKTGCALLSLFSLSYSFWDKDGVVYRYEIRTESGDQRHHTRSAFKTKLAWMGALYFFVYFGTQITLAGWIVSFMLRVRHASPRASSISATGFQAGQTVGRAIFGLVTAHISVSDFWFQLAMSCCLFCALGFQLVFWLVPGFVVSAISTAFLGFFLGPLFPAGVLIIVKLSPESLKVASIGLATALGGTGGAIFPFLVGAIAQAGGIKVLQPVILSLLIGISTLWLAFPKRPPTRS